MSAATSAAIARALQPCPSHRPSALTATAAVLTPGGFATPSAAGTSWRKISIAMPRVNPSITGQGSSPA